MQSVKDNSVKIHAHLNPHKDIIKIDGEGQSQLILTCDATQLAKVLTSFALYKNKLIEVALKPLKDGLKNGAKAKKRPQAYK